MSRHLTDAELMDLAERRPGAQSEHIQECSKCMEKVQQAGDMLQALLSSPLPEPSPFYWNRFRRELDERIVSATSSRPQRIWQIAAAGALSLGLMVALWVPNRTTRSVDDGETTLPAWSALSTLESDSAWSLVPQDQSTTEIDNAACIDIAQCLVELSDDQSDRLVEELRREMPQGRDL